MEATDIHTLSLISQIHWRPGIGDPTIAGWLTVIAYFLACLFSIACATRLGDKNSTEKISAQRKLWWFIALALLLLGINKQLDLQTLLTDIGRAMSKQEGWYEQRRNIQELFIVGVVCGGIFSLLIAWRTFRNVWKESWLTFVGMVFLVSFIIVRATSFHGVDRLLGISLAGLKINWILEFGGIIIIWISAIMCSQRIARTKQKAAKGQLIFL